MIQIDSSPIRYNSQKDEEHFFRWAQEIPCVVSVDRGVLAVDAARVSDDELRELLALLTRYRLSIEPLRGIANPASDHWFNDPEAYWNKK